MQIKILFDSQGINDKFSTGWGFSCLVNNRILFDTGEDWGALMNNMSVMQVSPTGLKSIVISHDHWDHTGGLWGVLEKNKALDIYCCPSFSDSFKKKLSGYPCNIKECDGVVEIEKNIYATGEILGEYKGNEIPEQVLVTDTENGLVVITGCAHPGIIRILEIIKNSFPGKQFYFVFGGFHLKNESRQGIISVVKKFKELGVKKAGPTHCSGSETGNIFQEEYGDNFVKIRAGDIFEV